MAKCWKCGKEVGNYYTGLLEGTICPECRLLEELKKQSEAAEEWREEQRREQEKAKRDKEELLREQEEAKESERYDEKIKEIDSTICETSKENEEKFANDSYFAYDYIFDCRNAINEYLETESKSHTLFEDNHKKCHCQTCGKEINNKDEMCYGFCSESCLEAYFDSPDEKEEYYKKIASNMFKKDMPLSEFIFWINKFGVDKLAFYFECKNNEILLQIIKRIITLWPKCSSYNKFFYACDLRQVEYLYFNCILNDKVNCFNSPIGGAIELIETAKYYNYWREVCVDGGSDCKIDRLDYHKNYHFVTQNSLLDCILATIQLQYEYRKKYNDEHDYDSVFSNYSPFNFYAELCNDEQIRKILSNKNSEGDIFDYIVKHKCLDIMTNYRYLYRFEMFFFFEIVSKNQLLYDFDFEFYRKIFDTAKQEHSNLNSYSLQEFCNYFALLYSRAESMDDYNYIKLMYQVWKKIVWII